MNDQIHKAFKRVNDCPELSDLLDAMQQTPADSRRVMAEQHIKDCPGCQTEWSLFHQFETGQVRPDERPHVDFIVKQVSAARNAERRAERGHYLSTFWQRFWTPAWIGGAALALAAIVMAIGITSQWRARHGAVETDVGQQTFRSQSLEITTQLREITQPPTHIEWKSVPGAANYAVRLSEIDGTRIFYTNVTSPSLPLPDNIFKLLSQGRTLLLAVSAFDSAGTDIAQSGIVKIRLSSNPPK
jgi:hypothetical protein